MKKLINNIKEWFNSFADITSMLIIIISMIILCLTSYKNETNTYNIGDDIQQLKTDESIDNQKELEVIIDKTVINEVETTDNNIIYTEELDRNNEGNTGTLENLEFIVDVTSINIGNENSKTYTVIGNTATEKSYSGEIWIMTNDITNIKVGNTYIFVVEPLMTMSEPPKVIAIRYTEATRESINELHEYRGIVSNFSDRMREYNNMELDDIIIDSNIQYTTWTNQEILKFRDFINKKGYTDDREVKSIVKIISEPFEMIDKDIIE